MTASFDELAVPNGVSSGDVTQTSAVLWTHAVETGWLTFEISADSSFHDGVRSKKVKVTDPLVPVKVEFDHLNPNKQYYYRAVDADGNVVSGTFETLAKLGTYDGLHFGVLGDLHTRLAPYPAIKNAIDADLDFVIKLGDTVTADIPTATRGISVLNDGLLATYQGIQNDSYSSHFGFNFLADLQATTAVFSIPDDHEVLDDYSGGAPVSSDPRFPSQPGADFLNETTHARNSMKAFGQYNAIVDRTYHGTGDDRFDGAPDFYRYNTFGSDAAIIMVDGRTFRDAEVGFLQDVPLPFPNFTFLQQAFEPGRTLLGEVQLERLKRDLLDARDNGVTWKLIVLQEPIQNAGPIVRPGDRYEGYAAERAELLKFIDQNHIENVVFITADSHWTMVNNLTYQDFFGGPQIATSAFEVNTLAVGDPGFAALVPPFAALLGVITPAELAFYNSLPIAPDPDDIPNDKDDFVKALINNTYPIFGYDPIGLDDNLAIANGKIDATLLKGDYFVGHSLGWTDFDIDATTGKLTVTTWGIEPFTQAELNANPDAIIAREPAILGQFQITPSDDSLIGTARNDKILGTANADVIIGASGHDELKGRDGDDYVDGGKGNDDLYGGGGQDSLFGRDGNDEIKGNDGDDRIVGGEGKDEVSGGDGNDTFIATTVDGNDDYDGDSGTDTVDLSDTSAPAIVSLERGSAKSADIGFDRLSSVENVIGGAGADHITGDGGKNRLDGGPGADTIDGGRDSDVLIGGAGNDTLIGGLGNDTFVFQNGFGLDTIVGFTAGPGTGDVIRLLGSSIDTFAEVLAATSDLGSDLRIVVGADAIVLKDIANVGNLHANDFLFV